MRAVIQRVSKARVTVEGHVTGEIASGLVVLLGVGREDTAEAAAYLAEKTANLRIFNDADGKMNRSLIDVAGAALIVSQFTLYGDARGQRRPGFTYGERLRRKKPPTGSTKNLCACCVD